MQPLSLSVISLRYSSWSMRPWLALHHAGASFTTDTAEIDLQKQNPAQATAPSAGDSLAARRSKGSVTGLFPVLAVGDARIHESLAICEWVNDAFPAAGLWPDDALTRARARSLACEMHSGFASIRTHLSCHLFGRLRTPLAVDAVTGNEITRVFELWDDALSRSGGPFLFGRFSIADCMYYPMRTRFRTYGVELPRGLRAYAEALDELPAVRALEREARSAPRVPVYDEYLRSVGGHVDGDG
jgi:glutathione S-transferase